MKLLLSLFMLLSCSIVFSQESYIRPMGMEVVGDSSMFPGEPYVKVVSYSSNRDTIAKKRFYDAIEGYKKYQKTDTLKAAKFLNIIDELDSIIHLWGIGIIENGVFSQNAEKVRELNQAEIDLVREFVTSPIEESNEPDLNCLPKYRDALVFFDGQNSIVGTIDFCFACLSSQFSNNKYYHLTYSQLLEIKRFFKEKLGHPVDFRPY